MAVRLEKAMPVVFYSNWKIAATGETAANQARLEYYSSNTLCQKPSSWYWLASAHTNSNAFCVVLSNGVSNTIEAKNAGGCSPRLRGLAFLLAEAVKDYADFACSVLFIRRTFP
jgi:hypothetical protein